MHKLGNLACSLGGVTHIGSCPRMEQGSSLKEIPEVVLEWWTYFVSEIIMVVIVSEPRELYAHPGDLLCIV